MAEKALRRLHKYVDLLDPSVLNHLYGENLITKRERERINAEGERTKKAGLILDALENRDGERAIEGLIEALKKDEEANEKFLHRIEEGKQPCYHFKSLFILLLVCILLCVYIPPR